MRTPSPQANRLAHQDDRLAAYLVTWFQLPADDMARALAFHGRVFGWRPDEVYSDRKRLGAINGNFAPRSAD